MYYPPAAASRGARGPRGSEHLCEALSLCQSILNRYRRTSTDFSSAEMKEMEALLLKLRDTMPSLSSPTSGAALDAAPHRDVSDEFLASLEEGSPLALDTTDDLAAFVVDCFDITKDPHETFARINRDVGKMLDSNSVQTFFAIPNDSILFDPVNRMAAVMDTSNPVGKCVQTTEQYTIGNNLYVPLMADDALVGCIQIAGGRVPFHKKHAFDQFISVATVMVRNTLHMNIRQFEANKTEAMLSMATRLARDTLDETVLVHSIMNTAKTLTESDRCSIFLVNDDGSLEAHFEDGNVVLLPEGTGIAGYVAKTGTVVNIPNAYEDDRFNRSVDKLTGYHTRTILCLPIVYEGSIVAVAQLINKLDMVTESGLRLTRVFGKRDEELFETFSMFAAASLRNCRINENLMTEKKKSDAILDVVTLLSNTDIRDVDSIVRHVLHGAKKLLNADRSSLFLLDKERNELYSRLADSVSGNEIRFPSGQGIAGTVAASATGENITDAYNDPRFNSSVDRQLGYRTQSILCEPIVLNGEVLAVVQLVNKLDGKGEVCAFSETDRSTFKVFSLFAGISINNSHLLEFAVKAGREAMELNEHRTLGRARSSSLKLKLASITGVERAVIQDLEVDVHGGDPTSLEFNLFIVREKAADPLDAATAIVYRLLLSTGLPQKFGCRDETLLNFILQCRKKYRRVPYHNFYHVVDVCQTLHTFLYHGKTAEYLTDLECYVLLITALVHDLDHMGVNNSFYLKTDSPLGILSSASGNNSVLEVHHCNLAIEILSDPDADVFAGLDAETTSEAYRALIDCVLATDMAKHAAEVNTFLEIAENGLDKENETHRHMVMQILMKAGDVSNVTKPFETSRLWAMAVTEEFYRQGDMEKEKGVEVLPMFDRSKNTELARGQIGFIDFVAGKFFRDIVKSLFHKMQWCVDSVESNRAQWQAILDGPRSSLRPGSTLAI